MIRKVKIRNFKSILDLTLDLGRVTVLVGANGSGKSNLLEAIGIASAAAQNKLDNEFLSSRGIRVTETRFMRSAFSKPATSHDAIEMKFPEDGEPSIEKVRKSADNIAIDITGDNDVAFACELIADDSVSFPKWTQRRTIRVSELLAALKGSNLPPDAKVTPETLDRIFANRSDSIPGFLTYAPENSSLRTFQAEGQILPLGTRGEGLFAYLKALNVPARAECLLKIKENLALIDWFDDFNIPETLGLGERSIRIRDRYLPEGTLFDQRSANEGFLFLLFYVTLLVGPDTPSFFAIDNIDSSLNPKLCIALSQQIVKLAKEHSKQVILTTHNPAVLDGLNLQDEDQRLLVVDRNKAGHTRVCRVESPKQLPGQPTVSLSEAFMRGYIGGLPKNF
jgi:predicted ATPase